MRLLVRTLLFLLLMMSYSMHVHADDGTFYKLEVGAGAGLGFGLTDANSKWWEHMGGSGALIVRFPLNARMAVKTIAAYTSIKGDVKDIKDFYPSTTLNATSERLHYTTNAGVYDLCAMYELHFLPYGFVQDFRGLKRVVPFIQLGLGATYANKSKAFTLNIPVGLGVKWKINRRSNVAVDWSFHFTPNDKLEGLSAPHGIKSTEFRNKDHYSRLLLTFTYDLSPTCPTCNKDRR